MRFEECGRNANLGRQAIPLEQAVDRLIVPTAAFSDSVALS
jgi:hypothetical protein